MKRFTEIINAENVNIARNVLMKSIQAQPVTAEATKTYLITKFNNMNAFYKQLTGLDELEYYQDRVIELQKSLTDAQQKRRELSYILNETRAKSIEIQDRLHKVKRHQEPAYFLELMREETDFIKREQQIFTDLGEQERYERDVFSAFTNAIRDSQEKQRNRLEYAKYIGFGLTLFGALGSYLITTWRTEDLKSVIRGSIKDDVRSVFVESAKDTMHLMQQLSKQQTQELHGYFSTLRGEIEKNKAANDGRFASMEQKMRQFIQGWTMRNTTATAEEIAPSDEWIILKWACIASAGFLALVGISSLAR